MSISDYSGPWFSAENATDIVNGKPNDYYHEPEQPPKKQYDSKTIQNKLHQIEKNELSATEKNRLKRYPQYGPKLTKLEQNNEIGRPKKKYSRIYIDILLTITANKRLRNIDEEISDAILQATLKPSEIDKLAQEKLGKQAYNNLKKSNYYQSFCKSIYNKQRRLKGATLKAKKHYIETYVTPLKNNLDTLSKKNELLRQIAFDEQASPEFKINIMKFATTHTYESTKQYINLLNKNLY